MVAQLEPAPRERTWQRFLLELDWWISVHGDAAVPQSGISKAIGEPFALGNRVKAYRAAHRRGALAADRATELESRAGWTWNGYTARSVKSWDHNLRAVQAYVTTHGSLAGLEAADAPAARWLRDQRSAALTPSQRRRLQRIPGALEDRKARFEEFLTALRGWMAAEPGRTAAGLRFTTVYRIGRAQYPLGRRAAYWRARYGQGRMPAEHVAALAAVPGWTWEAPGRSRGQENAQ
jgi:hypothetical protein